MNLNNENYFSPEMMMEYMSTSQFKSFEACEAAALAQLKGEHEVSKDAFKEGHYFEACLNGEEEIFLFKNPDMVSSRGATKGEIKSNFKKVVGSVEAFKRQNFLMDIVQKCQQQVIVTGTIAKIKFKGCIDYFNPETLEGFDTKCIKDFQKVYSESEGMYLQWYFAYGYHYQAAIYRELVRQTYGTAGNQHLLVATKEDTPDVAALCFSNQVLDDALEIIEAFAPKYDAIKRGLAEPTACGHCEYCKKTKRIEGFETIYEFE